ncbi:creatinase/prolidase [Thermacetogenium phaeum DSM 12270]|uniref:Creatinase/prolidase n=2 Tax=Thermacetogenium phaeum TaxID=85874 RepID=K4LV03_THEPS|nr:Xaa-Pro peptidase family protein [Thermacetogenium phaeum]AFV11854.1 creatinase/prolidase [Thermacetogenium phaeum DSM 12270]
MRDIHGGRLKRLRSLLEEQELEALLVAKPENTRYLSGFTGEALLLVTGEVGYLFSDGRYEEQARLEAPGWEFVRFKRSFTEVLRDLCRELGLRELGFEKDYLTYQQWEQLKDGFSGVLRPVAGLIEGLRLIKDDYEVGLIREAGMITAAAFRYVLGEMYEGQEEQEIAGILELYMRQQGGGPPAFEIIVASGERGALPHGTASGKKVRRGEFITLDFGARFQGYAADLTRTVAMRSLSTKQREVYELVREAQERALKVIRAGVTAAAVDAAARSFLEEAGYGGYFNHSLGHGVGLAVHEEPRLAPGQDQELKPGMVVTVEPGIYISGWGGVRIEDTVLVKQNGCEILTPVTKDLIVI